MDETRITWPDGKTEEIQKRKRKARMSVSVSEDIKHLLAHYARQKSIEKGERVSMSSVVEEALEQYFKRELA